MALAAKTALSAELIVIPAGNPWQRGRLPFAPAEQRVAMLRLAFGPEVAIDLRELHREGPTYTADTLGEYRREQPQAALFWLIGADAFERLGAWHRAAELPRLANFAVVARAGEPVKAPAILPETAWRVLPIAPPGVSSTGIRERLAQGQSVRGMAPEAVCDYIERHKLYQSQENTN